MKLSISYKIEHERRKDMAASICIEIFETLTEDDINDKVLRKAWNIGRKLKLGIK